MGLDEGHPVKAYSAILRYSVIVAGLVAGLSGTGAAQASGVQAARPVEIAALLPELPAPNNAANHSDAVEFTPAPVVDVTAASVNREQHRFWDRENMALFAVAGGLATADFCVTRQNLVSGGRELNPVTRVLSGSTPGLAANFGMEIGGLIAVDYLLHKTGHHKLERMASFVNIGASASAVGFDFAHR